MLDEGLARLELVLRRHLLLQGVTRLLHPVIELAFFLFLVDLVEVLVLNLLFDAVNGGLLAGQLPFSFLDLLLRLSNLT